jgi:hypothetical protein
MHAISKIRNVLCKNDQRSKLFGTRLEIGYGLKRNGNAPFQAEEAHSDESTTDSGDRGAGRLTEVSGRETFLIYGRIIVTVCLMLWRNNTTESRER